MIAEQSRAIRLLKAEVELLKTEIAQRRPPAGRPLKESTVAKIEQEIAAGGTDRGLARVYGVSHMSVYRIRKRIAARDKIVAESRG